MPSPGVFNTPFHWSDSELDTFPYKHFVKKIEKQKLLWKVLHNELLITLDQDQKRVTFERFVWAMEAVGSRAFRGLGGDTTTLKVCIPILLLLLLGMGWSASHSDFDSLFSQGILASLSLSPAILASKKKSICLLPSIDSANHKSSPNAKISFSPLQDSFILSSDMAIDQGEEVTISYGKRGNDDFLQYFGFVEVDNPHDSICLNVDNYGEVVLHWDTSKWDISCLSSLTRSEETEKLLEALHSFESQVNSYLAASNRGQTLSPLCSCFFEEKRKLVEHCRLHLTR